MGSQQDSKERWRPVVDFPDYEVSDYGRVKRVAPWVQPTGGLRRVGLLRGSRGRRGYRFVTMRCNGRSITRKVARLVLTAFIGPCPPGKEAAHWDGDPLNDRLDNLRWATHRENCTDKVRHGTQMSGERHHRAKLTVKQVREIRAFLKLGIGQRVIARWYHVTQGAIMRINTGRSWSHI